jgi:hypothetical protein
MRRILIATLCILAIAGIVGLTAPAARAQIVVTTNFANAPTGAHFVGNPTLACAVTATTVTCPTTAFEIAGVGNANAEAELTLEISAIVDCRNHGGQIVESHSQTTAVTVSSGLISPKNGRLAISSLTGAEPTAVQFQALATCPNPNWTAEVRPGTITLESFTFEVTFVGFTEPVITITGP